MNSLSAADKPFQHEIDLGEFWNRWTQLPFVFAVWAALPTVDFGLLDSALNTARDNGLNNIDEICRAASGNYPLTTDQCHDYLTKHLHFQLGEQEKQGLTRFFNSAKQLSIIDKDLSLQFYDCEITG